MKKDGITLHVSSRGLANIPNLEEDFTFHLKNAEYKINHILADFISPKIARIHAEDPTVDHFDFDITDNEGNFKHILRLIRGHSITIQPKNVDFFVEVGSALENYEIVESALQGKSYHLSITDVVPHLIRKIELGVQITKETSFIARNMWEIDQKELHKLDPSTIYLILKNPSLKVKNETQIFSLIYDLVQEKGDAYRSLFECVVFDNLPETDLLRFLEIAHHDDVGGDIWDSFRKRMLKASTNKVESDPPTTPKTERYFRVNNTFTPIKGKNGGPGIIAHLKKSTDGNPFQNDILKISALTIGSSKSCYQPEVVIDLLSKDFYGSNDNPDNWIQFEFTQHSVYITHYLLISYPREPSFAHLKS